MVKKTFTIVIPTYNRAKLVGKAIQSVMDQTCGDWEMLIMDDASTDDTQKVIAEYAQHPHVRSVLLDRNMGISHVMNRALGLVTTPYLIQLDSDDWLPPRALECLKSEILNQQAPIALYYGNVQLWKITEEGQYRKGLFIKHKQFKSKYDFLQYTSWMVGPRCYSVDALRDVEGWDTSDPYHGRMMEDRRIILKIIERFPVRWINKTLYHRTKHKNQLTDPENIRKRNELRKAVFDYYLERWGGKYRAVYSYTRNGYLTIRKLKRRSR